MQKTGFILVGTIILVALIGVLFFNQKSLAKKEIDMSNKKVLIAYYSYSGNTKRVAEKIQQLTNGNIFEIVPKKAYPNNYNDVVNLAKDEKQKDIKPELTDNGNVKDYDIIFLGTPVWWYTMASPVKTFISNNDFSGKTIVPFCTHGGGGASSTYIDMQKLAKGAKVTEGYTSYENSAKDSEIADWINKLKL